MSASKAQETCNSGVVKRNEQIKEIDKKIRKKEQEMGLKEGQIETSQEIQEKTEEKTGTIDKLKDSCIKEVATLQQWYEKGLKSYARKLTSNSVVGDVFTLEGCFDSKDIIKSCTKWEEGEKILGTLAETTLQAKVNDFLDSEFDIKSAILNQKIKENPNLEDEYRTQISALERIRDRKKQDCVSWCFEYREPNFFDRIRVLDHITNGKPPMWPQGRNYTENDCEQMVNTLKIPKPIAGRCSIYSRVESVQSNKDDLKPMINAVMFRNITDNSGIKHTIGDEFECSVRFKQEHVNAQYEINWVVNGEVKGSMGVFPQKDASGNISNTTAVLTTVPASFFADDTIGCIVTPIAADGTNGESVKVQVCT